MKTSWSLKAVTARYRPSGEKTRLPIEKPYWNPAREKIRDQRGCLRVLFTQQHAAKLLTARFIPLQHEGGIRILDLRRFAHFQNMGSQFARAIPATISWSCARIAP